MVAAGVELHVVWDVRGGGVVLVELQREGTAAACAKVVYAELIDMGRRIQSLSLKGM